MLIALNKTTADHDSNVLWHKTKADYYGHIAKFKTDCAKKEAAETAHKTYLEASSSASATLPAAHPIRLSLASNFSVFQYKVLGSPGKAIRTARTSFQEAVMELAFAGDNVAEDSYKDSKVIMQRILDQYTLWEKINR